MPVIAAREIYRCARLAGFSPDQAVTMTAIALAESGGDTGAHNPRGEDSRGLWQINVAAHTDLAGTNLYDPVLNARAAFRVSGGGADVSPWTTTHDGGNARYLDYRVEALAAARAAGDGGDLGVWTGTSGYGDPLAAGGGSGAPGASLNSAFAGGSGNDAFVQAALAQTGDRYVFGAEAGLDDVDPEVFDCSELTQWAAHRAGVDLPDGSWLQYEALEQRGGATSVEEALRTKGALLFYFSEPPTGGGRPGRAHVAISLGDGRTIEARGSSYGVGSFSADTSRFNYAAVIPELSGPGTGLGPALPVPTAPPDYGPAVDTDRDGLIDGREAAMGTDPGLADSDRDGVSDGYEVARLGTDPTRADSDGDRLGDSVELAMGSDPTAPDSDRDGRPDGATATVDADSDGVTDELERILGSDPSGIDSDADGFTDGLEYQAYADPTDPLSNPAAPPAPGGTPSRIGPAADLDALGGT